MVILLGLEQSCSMSGPHTSGSCNVLEVQSAILENVSPRVHRARLIVTAPAKQEVGAVALRPLKHSPHNQRTALP